MKKAAIAVAVAGTFATGATAAELSTFLYQQYAINSTEYDAVSGAGTSYSSTTISDSGSNMINFNYSDDLGNGLGLIGSLSTIANGANQGNGQRSNRNTFIGLTGDFGKITFGTHEFWAELNVILKDGWDANDAIGGATFNGIAATATNPAASFVGRRDQGIEWTSKNMNGFWMTVGYYEGSDAVPNEVDETGNEVNVNYSSGALTLNAGVVSGDNFGNGGAEVAGDAFDGSYVAFSYDLGTFSVAGSVQNNELYDSSQASTIEQGSKHLNVQFPTAGGRIIANVSSAGDRKEGGTTQVASGATGWDIGYLADLGANTKGLVRYANRSIDSDFTSTARVTGDTSVLQLGLRFVY